MKINQPIMHNNMNEIISYIEDIIKSKFDKNIKIFFPKNKNFFQNNFNLLKEICQKNKNIEKTLIYYKRNGYILINIFIFFFFSFHFIQWSNIFIFTLFIFHFISYSSNNFILFVIIFSIYFFVTI